jgi:hypothetical protein
MYASVRKEELAAARNGGRPARNEAGPARPGR